VKISAWRQIGKCAQRVSSNIRVFRRMNSILLMQCLVGFPVVLAFSTISHTDTSVYPFSDAKIVFKSFIPHFSAWLSLILGFPLLYIFLKVACLFELFLLWWKNKRNREIKKLFGIMLYPSMILQAHLSLVRKTSDDVRKKKTAVEFSFHKINGKLHQYCHSNSQCHVWLNEWMSR
jgi:hypothetical protein